MLIELLTRQYPGMRQWLAQRLTALVMMTIIVSMTVYFAVLRPGNYVAWRAAMSPIWMRLILLFFFFCLCVHAWLGVRDVLRDYIFNLRLRAVLQSVVDVLLIAEAVWMIRIVWTI